MTSRILRVLAWIAAILPCALLLFSAYFKFTVPEGSEAAATMASIGMWDLRVFYGVISLIAVALFLIPRTSTVGFVLMVGYYGGAIATILTHGDVSGSWPLVAMLVLLSLSALIRNPELLSRALAKPYPAR